MPAMSPRSVTAQQRALRLLPAFSTALLLGVSMAHAAPTGLLNDTGQTTCYNGSAMVACSSANTGDAAAYPRQDGRFGRDAAAPAKIGGGAAGFDFTRVCMNGTLNCAGAADTGASPAATSWACTKDNVTNLIWSLQSGFGDWTTYARTTLPNATNTANRCGFNSGWRVPTRRELLGIVHDGLASAPMIDTSYFPGTMISLYFTSEQYSSVTPKNGWFIDFSTGNAIGADRNDAISEFVRLVRSGQ